MEDAWIMLAVSTNLIKLQLDHSLCVGALFPECHFLRVKMSHMKTHLCMKRFWRGLGRFEIAL